MFKTEFVTLVSLKVPSGSFTVMLDFCPPLFRPPPQSLISAAVKEREIFREYLQRVVELEAATKNR